MKAKFFGAGIILMLLVVSLVQFTSAQVDDSSYLEIEQVRINGDVAGVNDTLYVERGDMIRIRVVLQANQAANNAYMAAYLSGYRYAHYEPHLVMAHTPTFNVPAGNKRSFDLNVQVPMEMQQKDAMLRLILFDENSQSVITYNYQLAIHGSDERVAVQIRNFFVSPTDVIEAGRALSFKVQVKNFGNFDLDDVTVRVAIPELNIQTFETIDWLRMDETQSFESLLLRIPQDAPAGNYEVVATVEYDRFQRTSQTKVVEVIGQNGQTGQPGQPTQGTTVVTIPDSIQVVAGTQEYQGSLLPISIENKGTTAKTYVLSVSSYQGWATATFEPSSAVVVQPGRTQIVYLRLRANEDVTTTEKALTLRVASGTDVSESIVLASVVEAKKDQKDSSWDARKILEWALVALIVVLIILGLIVVFRKMRKNNEDEDEQTYY